MIISRFLTSLAFFTFSCLVWVLPVHSQSNNKTYIEVKPTSVNYHKWMDITDFSSKQLDTLIQLSVAYSFTNEDTSLALGRRSVEVGEHHPDREMYAKALLELGDSYRIFGNLDEGQKLILEGKAIYETAENEGQVAYANNKLGALSQNKGDYETAITYYLDALQTWEKLKDTSNLINPHINIAWVFSRLDRRDKVEEYNTKALKLAELVKDDRAKMYVLNNMGVHYGEIAREYQIKAKSSSERRKVLRDSADYFVDKAMGNYRQCLALAKKMNNRQSAIRHLINMADMMDMKGEYDEAIQLTKEAESMVKSLNDIILTILVKRNMAEIYRHAGQFRRSADYGEAALKIAKSQGLEGYISSANKELYQTYKASGKFEQALNHYEDVARYTKKTSAADRSKAIAEVEAKYQTAQKEKEILAQKNEILELESTKIKIEKQRNYLIGGALFVGILGFLGFRINKITRERNDKIAFAEALIFAQEEERKRIARDLHDGVGQSLLLLKKQMESTFETTLENQEMIAETLEEVRSISRDLHPFQLEKFGLTATIMEAIKKVENSTDLFITHEIDNIDEILPESAQIHVFRTVQEALSNIVKHAHATAAKVTVQVSGETVEITIQDNGKGFDHEMAGSQSKSLGLRTMHERIAAIGGKLTIERGSPKGTLIGIKFSQG